VALLVARRTNDRKVVFRGLLSSVYHSVDMGVNCPLWPAATPSSEL